MIGDFIQILLLLGLLIICFRYARRSEDNLYLIFTALFFAVMLLSDLYYVTHRYLREGMRVPFAANDIADFGGYLLLSSALSAAVGAPRKKLPGVTAGALAFAAANIALWIGWSGEWVRDIFGGLPYAWFILVCFRSLYQTEALRRRERIALWAVCVLLAAVQTVSFFRLKALMDTIATVLLSVTEAWLLVRIFLSLRRGGRPEAALSLGFTGYMWVTTSMYMSADVVWSVFANIMSLHLLLLLLAVRKKVNAD